MGREGEEGKGQEQEKKRRQQEGEGGERSRFYSESGMPDCCSVTVGWSLDEMPTVMMHYGNIAQLIEHMLTTHKALGCVSSTT